MTGRAGTKGNHQTSVQQKRHLDWVTRRSEPAYRQKEGRTSPAQSKRNKRPDAGRPGKWMKGSSHKGARPKTSAADHIEPLGDLRNQCQVTAPAKGNQEATSHPEGQDKTPKLNECKGTMQRDGKTERRLLVMIAAGTVCQMTSYSRYSWGLAVSMLLATET